MAKKEGLIRGNILGKRIDFSQVFDDVDKEFNMTAYK